MIIKIIYENLIKMNKTEQVKEELLSLLSEHQSRCVNLGKDFTDENY